MNRADNCYDNAVMESCFGTIKTELEMTEFDHQQTAQHELEDYLAYCRLKKAQDHIPASNRMEVKD